ncbi:hypothetical protein N9L06_03830 [Mariniblastus sp.]|nr:hypothetical protein [Mariniblastus sp.]
MDGPAANLEWTGGGADNQYITDGNWANVTETPIHAGTEYEFGIFT